MSSEMVCVCSAITLARDQLQASLQTWIGHICRWFKHVWGTVPANLCVHGKMHMAANIVDVVQFSLRGLLERQRATICSAAAPCQSGVFPWRPGNLPAANLTLATACLATCSKKFPTKASSRASSIGQDGQAQQGDDAGADGAACRGLCGTRRSDTLVPGQALPGEPAAHGVKPVCTASGPYMRNAMFTRRVMPTHAARSSRRRTFCRTAAAGGGACASPPPARPPVPMAPTSRTYPATCWGPSSWAPSPRLAPWAWPSTR